MANILTEESYGSIYPKNVVIRIQKAQTFKEELEDVFGQDLKKDGEYYKIETEKEILERGVILDYAKQRDLVNNNFDIKDDIKSTVLKAAQYFFPGQKIADVKIIGSSNRCEIFVD